MTNQSKNEAQLAESFVSNFHGMYIIGMAIHKTEQISIFLVGWLVGSDE